MKKGGYYNQDDIDSLNEFKTTMIGLTPIKEKYNLINGYLDHIPSIKYHFYHINPSDRYTFGSAQLVSINGNEINKHYLIVYYKEDKPKLISIGGTYKSSDAEYRHNILPYNKFMKNVEKYASVFTDDYVEILSKNKVKLKGYNLPDGLDIKAFFCIFYMINTVKMVTNQGNIHSIFEFEKIITIPDDIRVSKHYMGLLTQLMTWSHTHLNFSFLGCKMIPLLVGDMVRMNDIKNHVWLEIKIATIVNNLVLNGRTPHLTYIFNKALLDTKKYTHIYDSPDNLVKLSQSKIADQIIFNLTKSKKLLSENPGNVYVKSSFGDITTSLDDAIKVTDNNIHYTDESLLLFTQHRGITMNSLLYILRPGKPIGVRTSNFKHKIVLFQNAYTLYVLNEQGIIHNDFHLNNATIYFDTFHSDVKKYHIYSIPKHKGKLLHKKHTVSELNNYNGKDHIIEYDINEQEHYYIPNTLCLPTIIDFGRSILKTDFEDEGENLKYQLTNKGRILNVYKTFYPEFYEKNKKHLYIEIDDFNTFFNKYAAIDLLRYVTMIITSSQLLDIPDDPDYTLILKIKHFLEDFLLTTKVRTENPNLLVMREFFKEYNSVPKDWGRDAKVTDIFCSQAPLYYNIGSYNTLPPFLKLFKMEKFTNEDLQHQRIMVDTDTELEAEGNTNVGITLL
jgi:hypothetical protein